MHILIFIAAIAALKLAAPLFIPFALAMFFFLLFVVSAYRDLRRPLHP